MSKLIQQYLQIKSKYRDAILLFRVGNCYELLGHDAKTVAEVIGLSLRQNEQSTGVENISVSLPSHRLDSALHQLVRKGYKVAVCEELQDPKTAKGQPKKGATGRPA